MLKTQICVTRPQYVKQVRATIVAVETSITYILIHIQQDATLHSLFYLEAALHVWGGISTHHQERKQLYLQHLVSALQFKFFHDSGR